MRKVLFVLVLMGVLLPAYALNPIKVGQDEVTPFLDAAIAVENRWGGSYEYYPGFTGDFLGEFGARYDHSEAGYKIQSNVSLVEGYITDDVKIGDLNFGWMKGNHQVFVGQGTYPFSIIMKNHHFNNRPEVWAPTNLSVFSYNIIGEYKKAAYYQYTKGIVKIKGGFIEDHPYFTNEEFKQKKINVPIVALNLNLTKDIEIEQVYSDYQGKMKTYITSMGIDLPKDFRLELEYVRHSRDGAPFNVMDSPDYDIALFGGVPNNMRYFMDGLTYNSYTAIISKYLTCNKKPLTLFAEGFLGSTGTNYVLESGGKEIFSEHKDYTAWGNTSFRLGYNYELTQNVHWGSEWESNTIDALPHWEQRWITSLRLKL